MNTRMDRVEDSVEALKNKAVPRVGHVPLIRRSLSLRLVEHAAVNRRVVGSSLTW